MKEKLLRLLRCPRCGGSLEDQSAEALICRSCHCTYQVEKDIPILWGVGKRSSRLEELDYDAMQPINPATVNQTSAQWGRILAGLFTEPTNVLELGAGTGILTEALLTLPTVRSVTASDVSRKFMFAVGNRLGNHAKFNGAVVCDANEAAFAENAFDVIVGRSVLHHFLDYQMVLRNVRSFLRPGGSAIFFEPVLEGKSVISLGCALILEASRANPQMSLSKADARTIKKILRHQTKDAWYPQTPSELDKLEDKYIFRLTEMKSLGIELGYSKVEIVDPQKSDPSYWSHIERTLRMMGVDANALQSFRWIGDAIRESYLCSTHNVPSPMIYFVFNR